MTSQKGKRKKARRVNNEATIALDDLPLAIKDYLIENNLIQDGVLVRN